VKIFKDLLYKIECFFGKHYSPYCKLCDSCGEEGCCSPVSCMYKCMVDERPKKCRYGYGYAHDLEFSYKLQNMYYKYVEMLSKKEITTEQFLETVDLEWDRIYDLVYSKKD